MCVPGLLIEYVRMNISNPIVWTGSLKVPARLYVYICLSLSLCIHIYTYICHTD